MPVMRHTMSKYSTSKSQPQQSLLLTAYHFLDIDVLSKRLRTAYSAWGKIPFDQIRERLELTDGKCFYCGCDLETNDCQLDHVIARTKGGAHTLSNVVMACRRCNQIKKNKPLEQFCREIGVDANAVAQRLESINRIQEANQSPYFDKSRLPPYYGAGAARTIIEPDSFGRKYPAKANVIEGDWRRLPARRRYSKRQKWV